MTQPTIDDTNGGVVLISGVPGAGKSTIARGLAETLNRAAIIEGDAVQSLIVSGGHPPLREDPEADHQLLVRERNVALLADSFASAGITAVVDDVLVHPERFSRQVELIRSRPLMAVFLAPRWEVVLARDAGRDKHVAEYWSDLDAVMRQSMASVGWWLDTSDQTVGESVAEITRVLFREGLVD